MNTIYSPPIWHLYLSLIFVCGLSKMNISDLKLCMHCWHLGLKDLCAVIGVSPILGGLLENDGEHLLACQRVVPGCSKLCAVGCGWVAGRAAPMLGTQESPPWMPTLSPLLSAAVGCAAPLPSLFFPLLWVSPCEAFSWPCFLGFILPSPFICFSPREHGAAPWQLP